MILVIDNYDSFTYNLVQCIEAMGFETVVRRNDAITVDEIAAAPQSAIVLSPGPCTPDDAGIGVLLVRRMSGQVPILGICLGHQCIAQAFGARVLRNDPPVHGKATRVRALEHMIFDGLPERFDAARYHSLAVASDSVRDPLEVIATGPGELVMGLAHREHPTVGIQFHPESYLTPHGPRIVRNFTRWIPCPSRTSPIA